MSDAQTIMKFEILPNEILIQCFEYLNASDIFHSFDQLNDRFKHLIRHIPLCINLEEDVNKSIFDKFCIKILLNPQIKDQVYLLNLPSSEQNDPASLQTKTFLSFFLLEDFWNLQKFKTSACTRLTSMGTESSHFNSKHTMKLSITSFPKLRALSIWTLDECLENTNLSITNLTLGVCDSSVFYYLSKHAPMLKYLRTNRFYCLKDLFIKNTKESFNGQYFLHLKQLIIDDFCDSFDNFETFVKLTPNLKSLTMSRSDNMTDAARWEQLITSSLPYLDIFQFKFSCSYSKDEHNIIVNKFKQFQTDFWQKQHHWFIECAVENYSALIYTIPYALNTYELRSNCKRYRNNLINNVNTFVNVTNLMLDYEKVTKNREDYFSNVTSLVLCGYSRSPTIEHIECLEKIVNLFNLKNLDISPTMNSSLLLKILEQTPQLFALTVWRHQLTRFFNNNELCKYLNKMVKRLHIEECSDRLADDLFQTKQFYEVFSNIEHLQFKYGRGQELLFSLNRLPKLSTLKAKWKFEGSIGPYLSQFANKVQKLNAIYDINLEKDYAVYNSSPGIYDVKLNTNRYNIEICMWFGNNMS